jgi:tRNA 2-thiocytidine biosynthesis protein TtcA
LCGSQDDLKRKEVKAFLSQWETRSPGCLDSVAAAIANVAPSLLMDQRFFDFQSLCVDPMVAGDGDSWMDADLPPSP